MSWTGGRSVLAEVGTLQLEFVALAQRVKDPTYAKKVGSLSVCLLLVPSPSHAEEVLKIVDVLAKADKSIPGLYPLCITAVTLTVSHLSFFFS
jgi:hypothetical protein